MSSGIENTWVWLLQDMVSSYCCALVWRVSNTHPATHSLPQWCEGRSRMRRLMGQDRLLANQCWGQYRFNLRTNNFNILPIKWGTKTSIKTTFLPTLPDFTLWLLTSLPTLNVKLQSVLNNSPLLPLCLHIFPLLLHWRPRDYSSHQEISICLIQGPPRATLEAL